MRARAKRRQTVRTIEIIAIIAIIGVSLTVGLYLAYNSGDPRAAVDGKPVSTEDLTNLRQAALAAYGNPGQQYLSKVQNLTGPAFSQVKPILVYVGAEFCPFCAVQRYSMIMALMRFGNFTGLEYMTSGLGDGDISTFTFVNSTYHSNFIRFEPFEIQDRNHNSLQTLPTNYTSAFQQQGGGEFPFLNFNNKFYIHGSILDYGILSGMNQTQVISSILAVNQVGSELKQAANVITAIICETTHNTPALVCDNASITSITQDAYSLPSTNSVSELTLAVAPSFSSFEFGLDRSPTEVGTE